MLRVSHGTVAACRSELGSTSKITSCGSRVGSDGKVRKLPNGEAQGQFEIPLFTPGVSWIAQGEGDSIAIIDPHPSAPNYAVVSVANPEGCLLFTDRGCQWLPEPIDFFLAEFGFQQADEWEAVSAPDGLREWHYSAAERSTIERRKKDYFAKHGKMPSLADAEFWNLEEKSKTLVDSE